MEVNFKELKRKDLQRLCKKHGLRANATNAQMADSLVSLFMICEKNEQGKVISKGSGGNRSSKVEGNAEKVVIVIDEDDDELGSFLPSADRKSSPKSRSSSEVDEQIEPRFEGSSGCGDSQGTRVKCHAENTIILKELKQSIEEGRRKIAAKTPARKIETDSSDGHIKPELQELIFFRNSWAEENFDSCHSQLPSSCTAEIVEAEQQSKASQSSGTEMINPQNLIVSHISDVSTVVSDLLVCSEFDGKDTEDTKGTDHPQSYVMIPGDIKVLNKSHGEPIEAEDGKDNGSNLPPKGSGEKTDAANFKEKFESFQKFSDGQRLAETNSGQFFAPFGSIVLQEELDQIKDGGPSKFERNSPFGLGKRVDNLVEKLLCLKRVLRGEIAPHVTDSSLSSEEDMFCIESLATIKKEMTPGESSSSHEQESQIPNALIPTDYEQDNGIALEDERISSTSCISKKAKLNNKFTNSPAKDIKHCGTQWLDKTLDYRSSLPIKQAFANHSVDTLTADVLVHAVPSEVKATFNSKTTDQVEGIRRKFSSRKAVKFGILNTPIANSAGISSVGLVMDKENKSTLKMKHTSKRKISNSASAGSIRRPLQSFTNQMVE